MKRNLLLFATLLLACNLVSCKTPGNNDTPVEPTGKQVKSIKMVEANLEKYPSVMEFTYDDQKRISKIAYELYSDEDEGNTEKITKIAMEMSFAYASDKITVVSKINGAEYNTSTAVIGADGLINRIDNTYEDEGNMVFEYSDKKISKIINKGSIEVTESGIDGNDKTVKKTFTEVVVPEWSGKAVSKITVTETIDGKEEDSRVVVDEVKYGNTANKANIDFNGIIDGGYGLGHLFGNPGMMVNKIGARTEFLVSEISSTDTFKLNGEETGTATYEKYGYKYTADKDGNVNKIDYTYKNVDSDGKVIEENSGTIEIIYND